MHERQASRPAGRGYPGPLDAGLSGTGLVADDLYLMAHGDRTGRPRLQPRPLGIGLAGALLGELMLAGWIGLRRDSAVVIVPGVSQDTVMRHALMKQIADEPGPLDTLEPAEVRVAVQIAIDTGRRPEDITGLPLDCLARDADGAPVLVYDNIKADRLGRRLPVSQDTADVIIAQQQRVTARFPATPRAGLPLLPASRRNPDGRRPTSINMMEGRHREWVARLGPLRTRRRHGVRFREDRALRLPAHICPKAR